MRIRNYTITALQPVTAYRLGINRDGMTAFTKTELDTGQSVTLASDNGIVTFVEK